MAANSLCRCIYGARYAGTNASSAFDPQLAAFGGATGCLEEVGTTSLEDEQPFQSPQITGLLSYSDATDQPLRGQPIREGELWHLMAEEQVQAGTFALYINGFSFSHGGQEVSVSLSPFSLVRNCRFQSTYASMDLTEFKIFKISLFTHGSCFYYGVRGADDAAADEERGRWVLDISRATRLVTQSLFPAFAISCNPLGSVASTQRRLMAGYLVHHAGGAVAAVLYCELHPQSEGKAMMTLYENELCQTPVLDITLTERSICCEKVGINCSCFSVEDQQFSTRTLSERKLWLRAISNVKVKLQNRAPSPTSEELRHYRLAIKEHLDAIKATLDGQPPMDALLRRNPRTGTRAGGPGATLGLELAPPGGGEESLPDMPPRLASLESPPRPATQDGTGVAVGHASGGPEDGLLAVVAEAAAQTALASPATGAGEAAPATSGTIVPAPEKESATVAAPSGERTAGAEDLRLRHDVPDRFDPPPLHEEPDTT